MATSTNPGNWSEQGNFTGEGNSSDPRNAPGPGGSFIPPGWPFECFPLPGLTSFPPPTGIYREVENRIWEICPPIVISIGSIGNLLTAIVILRQFRRINSTCMFLLTLALSDTAYLYLGPLRQMYVYWNKEDLRGRTEAGCKVQIFLTYATAQFSSWLLVAVTVERAASVMWPLKMKYGFNKRLAAIVILVMFVAIFGLNLHLMILQGVSDLPFYQGEGICHPTTEHYRSFTEDVWPWIDFFVLFAIPFGILLVGNIIIILTLRRSRSRRRKMSLSETKSESKYKEETNNVIITLILLSVVFAICLTPVSIFFIYQPYKIRETNKIACVDGLKFFEEVEKNSMTFTVVNVLSSINAAFNFILYTFSGSKFRNELKKLILCRSASPEVVFGSSQGSRRSGSYMTSSSRQGSINSRNCGVNENPKGEDFSSLSTTEGSVSTKTNEVTVTESEPI